MTRLYLLLLTFCIFTSASALTEDEIRCAIQSEYAKDSVILDIESLIADLNENGEWPDIDYSDKSPSLWQLEHHLDRIVELSKAYRQSAEKDTAALDAVNRALNNWFYNNYTNPNWWYGKIGVPRRMLAIAYLIDNKLTPELKEQISHSLDIIDSNDFPARPGGDRIQVLSNHAKVLLWKNDYQGVKEIFNKIEAEARIAPNEDIMYDAGGSLGVRNNWRPSGRGVQADMSFHHRGDRVNSTLTYGMELPEFFIYWAEMLKNSDNAFSEESIKFIIDYYLDGINRHLVAGRFVEPTILNRELARPGQHKIDPDISQRLLSLSDGYRTAELEKAFKRANGDSIANDLQAKYFNQSDYFTFSRPEFQTAVRIYSERNANQEAPHNNEGIRNHFRGEGANMLSVTGEEYTNIYPIFDFRKIPGTTTPLIPYEPLEDWGDVVVLNSPIKFAGAVNDSIYGAVAFDFESSRSDLKARKAWFFFDNECVCLGAGINSNSGDSIVTTIEQCLVNSPAEEKDNWWFASGNAYHVLDGKAVGKTEEKRGTWSNCVRNVEYVHDSVCGKVFTLMIEHGTDPRNESYAYAIVPETDKIVDHQFKIISNNPQVQGVASDSGDLIYLVFYEAGEMETPIGKLKADAPCVVMVRNNSTLYVADPTRDLDSVNITTPAKSLRINLPKGQMAGTSVEAQL